MKIVNNKAGRGICSLGLLIVIAATGCWQFTLTPIQPPYTTKQPPYVAKLMFPYQQKEKVLDVIVYEEVTEADGCSSHYEARWHIKATEPIPGAGFEVTIGRVPPGFEQAVPEGGDFFAPVVASKYVLEIKTTNKDVTYCSLWCPNIE